MLQKVLEKCRTVNLKLNYAKCSFEQSELKYLGHIIGQGVIKPDPAKITAITDMPKPENREATARLLGMATYLGKFCPNLAEITAPLRQLTKKNSQWLWGEAEETSWKNLKNVLTSGQTLKIFDPKLPVTLSVDSSRNGMGAVVLLGGQPVEFASCSLTSTQKAYAQIEKEFLAVQYGLKRFHQYIYGQHVTIETDHLPLLSIIKKGLNDLTPRLLRMRLRTTLYDYTLVYKPGKKLYIADTLSRAYLNTVSKESDYYTSLDCEQIHAITTGTLPNPIFREVFTKATINGSFSATLKSYIQNGWPKNKRSCIEPLKPFWKVKSELTIHEDIILRGCQQLVVPLTMRKKIISEIHKGHLGISKCIERAKNSVYWPGYLSQIQDIIEACSACQENMRANIQTTCEPYSIPEYPMQTVSMDIFYLLGKEYLVTVDRYSKWPTCTELKNSMSREIIEILKKQFLDFGRPETLISDNASYFVSKEFKQFIEDFDIRHTTTSPYYSKSNGLAERMNQTIKNSLNKAMQSGQTLFDVLGTLRSTPLGEGLPSPSVLLQSRNLRSNLNFVSSQLKTQQVNNDQVIEALHKRQGLNQTKHQKQAEKFIVGMKIWVKTGHRQWVEGEILAHAATPRSFLVKLSNGQVTRRNQSFLRIKKIASNNPSSSSSGSGETAERVENNTRAPMVITNIPAPSSNAEQVRGSGNRATATGSTTVTRGGRVSRPPQRYGQNIYDK